MGRRVYLTGFEPFLKIRENPTEAIVQRLDGERFGDVTVASRVLPVAWEKTPSLLLEDLDRIQPALCVHLGVSGQAQVIRLERFAYNTIRSAFPDNVGAQPEEQPIEIGRPVEATLETPLPLAELLERLKVDGVPAEISTDPGRYLCNRAYYASLNRNQAPAIFIHIPHTDNRDPSGERWTLQRLRIGTESILRSLCEAHCDDPSRAAGLSEGAR
tara:strand:+ start:296 stop:940 length:645 start_codon:yes stop_codon:yes gene_type:complete